MIDRKKQDPQTKRDLFGRLAVNIFASLVAYELCLGVEYCKRQHLKHLTADNISMEYIDIAIDAFELSQKMLSQHLKEL